MIVFVMIEENGNDRFYILPWVKLRDLLVKGHTAYLKKHKGVRPNNYKSLQSAISEKTLKPYLNKWSAIEKKLK